MAHVRYRKFNTKAMYPDQALDNDLSMVVRAGRHVFVRGQTAMDFDGKLHGVGDATLNAQTSGSDLTLTANGNIRESRVEAEVTVATLLQSDSAKSILVRLTDQARRAAS